MDIFLGIVFMIIGFGLFAASIAFFSKGERSNGFILSGFSTALTTVAVLCFWSIGLESFAPQLGNGEEATVLAVIPAADSLYAGGLGYKVPDNYRYVLVLKNNKGRERREFWSKPDSVWVGSRIGRLKSSGLILVEARSPKTTALATR